MLDHIIYYKLTFAINVLGVLEGTVEYLKSYLFPSRFIKDTTLPSELFPCCFKILGMAPKYVVSISDPLN